ncbi:hypothetical protein JXL19_03320 [bacterium]|nr:hypothetical protein [bacterium]
MNNSNCKSTVIIKGIITAVEWDEDNNIIAISLSTSDEEEYHIEDNPFMDELLNLVYEPVRVTGIINSDDFGYKSILIQKYELLDEGELLNDKDRNISKT